MGVIGLVVVVGGRVVVVEGDVVVVLVVVVCSVVVGAAVVVVVDVVSPTATVEDGEAMAATGATEEAGLASGVSPVLLMAPTTTKAVTAIAFPLRLSAAHFAASQPTACTFYRHRLGAIVSQPG